MWPSYLAAQWGLDLIIIFFLKKKEHKASGVAPVKSHSDIT